MIKATKPITKINRIRHDIDATGIYLGRLAVQIAVLLRGKNKTSYTPNADCGDTVFVSNVNKLKFSGNKINQKIYYRHSGYIGNLKETKLKDARLHFLAMLSRRTQKCPRTNMKILFIKHVCRIGKN